jgi:hypothetical protein
MTTNIHFYQISLKPSYNEKYLRRSCTDKTHFMLKHVYYENLAVYEIT